MWSQIVENFVTLWVVIDPIGTIPVFIAFTRELALQERRAVALRATFYALIILTLFLVGGQHLLEALAIPLGSFQIAGGVVLFLFALTMIFGPSKPEEEQQMHTEQGHDAAVYPLAVPSIASPGAMLAIVVLTDNHRFDLTQQLMTGGAMVAVLLITLTLLLLATPIQRVIGNAGASIISRVMGLILASVATEQVLSALKLYFQ